MNAGHLSKSIQVGALLLALSSLLSRLLGLLRDAVFSGIFGVGAEGGKYALDAYYLAFKIPDFLYTLLIFGALSSAFIPLYTELRTKNGQEKASHFGSQVLTGVMTLLVIFTGLAFLLAPYLIPLLAPGFTPEVQSLSVDLTRIMLLSPLFLGLSSIFQGIENAHKSFWGMALAPLLYNTSLIASAFFFGVDHGVYALAWGVALGALLHLLVQVPGVFLTPFHFEWILSFKGKEWKEFMKLAIPRIIGTSALQISVLTDAILATLLPLGSLSLYAYAFNLQSLPYGIVAVAVSTAVFTSLSEQAENKAMFTKTLRHSLYSILYWVLPAVFGLFILREPIIQFFLERGAFTSESTLKTAELLAIFVWSALPQSIIPLFSRAFYSLKETWIPVIIALVSLTLGLSFNLLGIFIFKGGIEVLAWGNLLAGTFNALLLAFLLFKKFKLPFKEFLFQKDYIKIGISLALMLTVLFVLQSQSILISIPLAGLAYLVPFRLTRH